jgi:hypothetical protein
LLIPSITEPLFCGLGGKKDQVKTWPFGLCCDYKCSKPLDVLLRALCAKLVATFTDIYYITSTSIFKYEKFCGKDQPPAECSGDNISTERGVGRQVAKLPVPSSRELRLWLVLFYIFWFRLRRNKFVHLVVNFGGYD